MDNDTREHRELAEACARPIKLDLGAGPVSPAGFTPMGADHGSAIFPLDYPDDSVDEIRASHVLEHFPHRQVIDVLREWVRVLRPGGRMRIAVPDLLVISQKYIAGEPINVQGYLMGGQIDANDFHKCAFDEEALGEVMAAAGLLLIRRWTSELEDAAALPISLNLEGRKSIGPKPKIHAVMSAPRLGFMDNFVSVIEGLVPLGIPFNRVTGSNWGQCLTRGMESALEDPNLDLVLTLDYDTVFKSVDLVNLIQTIMVYPEVDALAPVQSSRGNSRPLLGMTLEGEATTRVPYSTFAGDVTEIATAHFGLTLLRARKLRELPRPWLHHVPDPDGGWNDGRVDDDIAFWHKWKQAGNRLFLANRIPVGHAELVVLWPGKDLSAIYQPMRDYHRVGKPPEAWS